MPMMIVSVETFQAKESLQQAPAKNRTHLAIPCSLILSTITTRSWLLGKSGNRKWSSWMLSLPSKNRNSKVSHRRMPKWKHSWKRKSSAFRASCVSQRPKTMFLKSAYSKSQDSKKNTITLSKELSLTLRKLKSVSRLKKGSWETRLKD